VLEADGKCWKALVCVRICWYVLECVGKTKCWEVLGVGICRCVLEGVGMCWKVLICVRIC